MYILSKNNIRKLWKEEVRYRPIRNGKEKGSIDHCQDSDYKYKIFCADGQYYRYNKSSVIKNEYDSVTNIIYLIK